MKKDLFYMILLKYFKIYLLVLFLTSCSVFGLRSGYKEINFDVVDSFDAIEIRKYPSRVVVEHSKATNRNDAFYPLFKYISGENIQNKNISMTTPVELNENLSEKISMTAPVEIREDIDEKSIIMRFFLPSEYTLESAPVPNDSSLLVKELPEQTIAVLQYSGSTSNEKFLNKKKELLDMLKSSKWEVEGQASFLGYDPPFTIPFLRRNEVIVPVKSSF
jgi:hypothetical protein